MSIKLVVLEIALTASQLALRAKKLTRKLNLATRDNRLESGPKSATPPYSGKTNCMIQKKAVPIARINVRENCFRKFIFGSIEEKSITL